VCEEGSSCADAISCRRAQSRFKSPFSSTSFWRGLHFAVQKHLADSLHRATLNVAWFGRESSVIIDRRLPVRASGSCSTTTAATTTALAATVRAAGEVRVAHRMHMTAIPSACVHPKAESTTIVIMLTVIMCLLAGCLGRVRQVPWSRASFWRGLYFPIQTCTHRSALCTRLPHVRSCGAFHVCT